MDIKKMLKEAPRPQTTTRLFFGNIARLSYQLDVDLSGKDHAVYLIISNIDSKNGVVEKLDLRELLTQWVSEKISEARAVQVNDEEE